MAAVRHIGIAGRILEWPTEYWVVFIIVQIWLESLQFL